MKIYYLWHLKWKKNIYLNNRLLHFGPVTSHYENRDWSSGATLWHSEIIYANFYRVIICCFVFSFLWNLISYFLTQQETNKYKLRSSVKWGRWREESCCVLKCVKILPWKLDDCSELLVRFFRRRLRFNSSSLWRLNSSWRSDSVHKCDSLPDASSLL